MVMLIRIILQFLKQKVIEISKLLLILVIVLIILCGGIIGFVYGTGWIIYSIFHNCKFLYLLLEPKNNYYENIIGCGVLFLITCMIGFAIFMLTKTFIEWIGDNWRTAKEIVLNKHMPTRSYLDEEDD